MDNKIILLGGAAILALVMLKGNSGGGTGALFTVPAQFSGTGQAIQVRESNLPQYGYVKYQGSWYHSSQFPPQGSSGTSQINWQNWATILQNALNTGMTIYQATSQVVTAFQAQINVTPNWTGNSASVVISVGTVQKNFTVTKNGGEFGGQINNNLYYEVLNTSSQTTINVKKLTDDTTVTTKTINWTGQTIAGLKKKIGSCEHHTYQCSYYGCLLRGGSGYGGTGLNQCRWDYGK